MTIAGFPGKRITVDASCPRVVFSSLGSASSLWCRPWRSPCSRAARRHRPTRCSRSVRKVRRAPSRSRMPTCCPTSATAPGPCCSTRACPSKSDGTPRAAVLVIHGGSWTRGDKADEGYGRICRLFAAHGYAAFSLNYRLAPTDVFPAAIDDVTAGRALASRADSGRTLQPRPDPNRGLRRLGRRQSRCAPRNARHRRSDDGRTGGRGRRVERSRRPQRRGHHRGVRVGAALLPRLRRVGALRGGDRRVADHPRSTRAIHRSSSPTRQPSSSRSRRPSPSPAT